MRELTQPRLRAGLMEACRRIVASEPMLTQLDQRIGDGDHGIGMKIGFSRLLALLEGQSFPDIRELTRQSGLELVKTMGGASGVIFGSLFIGGCPALAEGAAAIDAGTLVRFFEGAAASIAARGGAKRGDKTMLDALAAAVDSMRSSYEDGGDVLAVLRAGADGAQEGAEATKGMLPQLGRSKNFRDSAFGYPDPGAVSTAILFQGLYQGVYQS